MHHVKRLSLYFFSLSHFDVDFYQFQKTVKYWETTEKFVKTVLKHWNQRIEAKQVYYIAKDKMFNFMLI